MEVEMFDVTETNAAGVADCSEEQKQLIEKLGLRGQTSIFDSSKDGSAKPYRQMTQVEFFVYSRCFPRTVKLEDFNDHVIPLRVLQAAALCKERGWFEQLWVMMQEVGKDDPVLVGSSSRHSISDGHLIARWGDALLPFDQLAKQARARFRDEVQANANEQISKIQQQIEQVNDPATDLATLARMRQVFW